MRGNAHRRHARRPLAHGHDCRHDLRGLEVGQQHTTDFRQDFALQNAPLLVAPRELGQVLLLIALRGARQRVALAAYCRHLGSLLSPAHLVARIAMLVPGGAVISPLAARVGEG